MLSDRTLLRIEEDILLYFSEMEKTNIRTGYGLLLRRRGLSKEKGLIFQ
jgi:hypothetical protein